MFKYLNLNSVRQGRAIRKTRPREVEDEQKVRRGQVLKRSSASGGMGSSWEFFRWHSGGRGGMGCRIGQRGRRRAPYGSHGAAVYRPLNQVSDGSGKQKVKKIKDQQNQQPSELERERLSEPCEAGVGVDGQEAQGGNAGRERVWSSA